MNVDTMKSSSINIYPSFFKKLLVNCASYPYAVRNYCGEYVVSPLVKAELSYL